jgi:predicted amidohydrolase
MARWLTVGAAQMGPVARGEGRDRAVQRMIALLGQASSRGVELVVFPEVALTAFFPHWWMEDPSEVDRWFEREMPGPETRPLFEEAKRLGLGFVLGYAELAVEDGRNRHYNTSILVAPDGRIVGKYRKIHLPGGSAHEPGLPFQNLEKRYFDVGDLGFPVWRAFGGIVGMCICNDRRWPEAYRVMGLQGVELVCLGYNTPAHHPHAPEHDRLSEFHNRLVMQAGAYQNGTWVVGTAKCGLEEGCAMIGQSQIISPSGETVAMASTLDDELVTARCDLDLCRSYKETIFNFARHRRPEHYRMIVERTGAVPPP